MPYGEWQAAFMQDASEDVQRLVHSLLVPQPVQYFTTAGRADRPNRLASPVTYLLSEDDITLPEGVYE